MLVIAGCHAAFSLFSALISGVMAQFLPSAPQTSNVPVHTMQAALTLVGLIYLSIAAPG